MENVAGEQGLLTSNIFHTNPSNFPKIQAAINTHSAMLGGSNLATFIFLTRSFYFWNLFCTTTVFNDWQGHVTVSCKQPSQSQEIVKVSKDSNITFVLTTDKSCTFISFQAVRIRTTLANIYPHLHTLITIPSLHIVKWAMQSWCCI